MALMVCRRCGTKFSVGAPRCPQCTSEQAYEEGTEDVGKSTVLGGTTVTDDDGVTRSVNDDGSVGDPIHDDGSVEGGEESTTEPETESTTDVAATGKPRKATAPKA